MPINLDSAIDAEIGKKPAVQGSPIKGSLIGLIVSLLGFFLISSIPDVYFAIDAASRWPKETRVDSESFALLMSTNFAIFNIACALSAGFFPALMGGYIFARISRRSNYRLAWFISIVLASSLFFLHGSRDYTLSWEPHEYASNALLMQVLVTILSSVGIMLGAKYGMRMSVLSR